MDSKTVFRDKIYNQIEDVTVGPLQSKNMTSATNLCEIWQAAPDAIFTFDPQIFFIIVMRLSEISYFNSPESKKKLLKL